jgi:hypothetical protein
VQGGSDAELPTVQPGLILAGEMGSKHSDGRELYLLVFPGDTKGMSSRNDFDTYMHEGNVFNRCTLFLRRLAELAIRGTHAGPFFFRLIEQLLRLHAVAL